MTATATTASTLADVTAALTAAGISNGIERTITGREFVQLYTVDAPAMCEVIRDADLAGLVVYPQGAPGIYNVEQV